MIHELSRLKMRSHGPEFWVHQAMLLPDYERPKGWLDMHQGSLDATFLKVIQQDWSLIRLDDRGLDAERVSSLLQSPGAYPHSMAKTSGTLAAPLAIPTGCSPVASSTHSPRRRA